MSSVEFARASPYRFEATGGRSQHHTQPDVRSLGHGQRVPRQRMRDPGERRARVYSRTMTVLRDEFHQVVDQIPADELGPLLNYVRTHAHLAAAETLTPVWDGPDFIGAFASGRGDVSEHGDGLLFQEHPTRGGSARP